MRIENLKENIQTVLLQKLFWLRARELICKIDVFYFYTGEHGDSGLNPSASVLTFDLLVIMGSTVLLTAESPQWFWGEERVSVRVLKKVKSLSPGSMWSQMNSIIHSLTFHTHVCVMSGWVTVWVEGQFTSEGTLTPQTICDQNAHIKRHDGKQKSTLRTNKQLNFRFG